MLGPVRRALARGQRPQAAVLARIALRRADPAAAPALAAALLDLFNAAPYPAGVAIALRAARRYRELAPGEARRLFRLLDRTGRPGLVDRYVPLLTRWLAQSDLPIRRAMIAIWSTGRHQALVDFVRRERPAKLADPQTFRFFAERSIHFGDHGPAAPVLAELLAAVPHDEVIRHALIRGLIERRAFAEAAQIVVAARSGAEARVSLDDLGAAIVDALDDGASAAMLADIRVALETIVALDPENPVVDDIARALPQPSSDAATASPGPPRALSIVRAPIAAVPAKLVKPRRQWIDTSELAVAISDLARHPVRSPESIALRRRIENILATADLPTIAPLLDRLLAVAPRFAHQIAARFADPEDGVALFAGLDPRLPLAVWRAAMALAERAGANGALAGFALRVASKDDVPLSALQRVSSTVARACDADSLDAFWVSAAESARSLTVGIAGLRALFGAPVSPGFYVIAAGLFDGSLRDDDDPARLVEATRLILARGWRWSDAEPIADATIDPTLPAPMALWLRAVIDWAQGDRVAALRHLDEGVALAAPDAPVSFVAERALINWRFGHWGAAAADLPALDISRLRGVHTRLAEVAAFAAVTPLAPDATYPECLIDTIFDRAPTTSYQPVPGSVATIVTALAAGGSEKQAVSVVTALTREPRVAAQTMFVRSLDSELHAFFLPRVIAAGVPHLAFGDRPVDVAAVLAETGDGADSPLAAALTSLSDWLRSSIGQLVPLLREARPAVAHIRQDYVAAALACVLAGVPRILLHRGSLSPDYWDLRPSQVLARVRPMRHAYRRLLDWPGFAFVNNSAAGLDSDRAWLERDDSDRFHLVHNIVDFAQLGHNEGPNAPLRASLGIPAAAPVIGAAFRFQKVKRPMLWLQAARALLTRRPDAHFLIVGDGELREEMTAFAAAAGFSDRLHLPGTIDDVGAWYRAMTIALLTSDREGLPNLLIEAQHFGVPVLSTDVGGARETMDVGVTGRLVPATATAEQIADTIDAMLDDPAWCRAARDAAPAYVHERFGADTAVARLMRLYGFDAD
ncbi:glycosyltransferase [Sphingomonas sp. SUN019]|uniref:glycosyltransferase n=1 Tax=Sphingomonas sp. SUN019 TaxID=2937788 RepID=UPI0021649123|nr:glycosyltransferase [Sphingomonas sp. SUN019]UVO50890.1 glycosyltransferase [Sphingomonas sp. SUN019]